jgi:hypothetical protein
MKESQAKSLAEWVDPTLLIRAGFNFSEASYLVKTPAGPGTVYTTYRDGKTLAIGEVRRTRKQSLHFLTWYYQEFPSLDPTDISDEERVAQKKAAEATLSNKFRIPGAHLETRLKRSLGLTHLAAASS